MSERVETAPQDTAPQDTGHRDTAHLEVPPGTPGHPHSDVPPPLDPSYAREMADLQMAELFRIEAGSGGRHSARHGPSLRRASMTLDHEQY